MNHPIKAVTVFLFLLFMLLPSLQENLSLITYAPLQENRFKEKKPMGAFSLLSAKNDYAARYEAFYNDTYGLRDFLIRLKNQLDYSIFGHSAELVVGKEHYLFYKSVVEKEEIYPERASEKEFTTLIQRLLKLNAYLQSRGIIFLLVSPPQKNTVYPEYLPANTANRPSPSVFERYLAAVASHPEIKLLDARKVLIDLKPSMQVFYKTDFHWTDPAGFVVARRMVNFLGKLSGIGRTWIHPLKTRLETVSGGQNNSLAIFFPYNEQVLVLENAGSENYGALKDTRKDEWVYTASSTTAEKLLPPTVLFSDSYSDAFVRAGFMRYFSEIHKYHFHNLKERFHEIPANTRILILEHIEIGLNQLLNDQFWPEEFR